MIFGFLFGKKRSDAELGQPIGTITHYFSHVKVGVMKIIQGTITAGDTIYIKGHTSNFEQKVKSMQVDHKPIDTASKGQEIGMKIKGKVRRGDKVYKI